VTARRVIVTEEVSLSLGRYMDDPAGLAEVLDVVDALGEDPRPPVSFHRGEYHRLRVGRYRVLYEITEDTVLVRHIARVATR
jgi:mRNA-degrading endonuclease RelE of RelBE toxin-antitoxin system